MDVFGCWVIAHECFARIRGMVGGNRIERGTEIRPALAPALSPRPCGARRPAYTLTKLATASMWWVWGNMSTGVTVSSR